jgi:hypothetical protein
VGNEVEVRAPLQDEPHSLAHLLKRSVATVSLAYLEIFLSRTLQYPKGSDQCRLAPANERTHDLGIDDRGGSIDREASRPSLLSRTWLIVYNNGARPCWPRQNEHDRWNGHRR